MKPSLHRISLGIALAFGLSGCAAWNKYDLREVRVATPSGSPSVAVACVDERDTLMRNVITSNRIGVTRGLFAIPFQVNTATKEPVAVEIAQAITQGFGPGRKLAPPMAPIDTEAALQALNGTGADRQILVAIGRYNSDTLFRTELDYAIRVDVYDQEGHLLASASRGGLTNLGGNPFLPARHARIAVIKTTGNILSELLAEPQIRQALNDY